MGEPLQNKSLVEPEYRPCPTCRNGEVYSAKRGIFVPCTTCKGDKQLVINMICTCGEPIRFRSKDGFFFCGDDKICLPNVRIDAESEIWEGRFERAIEEDHRFGWSRSF